MISICLSRPATDQRGPGRPSDKSHPIKRHRPVPPTCSVPLAYVQWIALMVIGWGWIRVSRSFAITVFILWVMGCIYNISPIRSKDVPRRRLSEAVNNRSDARRLVHRIQHDVRARVALMSYWMVGCYFMAIGTQMPVNLATGGGRPIEIVCLLYPERLIVSVMFYGSAAMLFLGAFVMRYRLELILAFPRGIGDGDLRICRSRRTARSAARGPV